MVRRPRRQYGARRDLFPGAGSDRRHHHAELRRHQRHRRHPRRQRHHLLLRPADRLSCRQMRHRYRPADARRRLRLYRLDHHLADLRLLHLHLLRARGGHPRNRAGDVLRHPAPDRLSHQRGRHHSAGDLRHHPDQPLPAVDAAALDHPAHPPLRGDRLRQSALVHGMAEIRRRAWRRRAAISICCCSAPRPRWCFRWWRRSASRSTSCGSCRATAAPRARRGGSRCSAPAPAGSSSARSSCCWARSSPTSRSATASPASTPPSPRTCISKRFATCCRSPIWRWR